MIGPDSELLRCYAFDGSESAFSEIVRRHLNLVYSTALRQVGGDECTASDVVQTVFSDLACKARSLTGRASLAGWLYTSTHYAAAKAVRSEQRRRAREQKAFAMQQANDGESNSQWEQVQPILDRVMHELREEEREALVLRFFEQRDLHTVGQALGVSAEAARKRVDRSLEKLRSRLAKHGVSSTSAALCAGMSSSALTAAPLGLAPTITTAALGAAASANSLSTLTLINLMTSTKIKIGIASLLLVSAATIPIMFQHRNLSRIRSEHDQARQENGRLREQLDESTKKFAKLLEEYQRQQAELASLRLLKAEMAALNAQRKREQTQTATSSVSPGNSNAEAGRAEFEQLIDYVANLRKRGFGSGGKELTVEEKKWLEEAKPYFKELLKSPDQFAKLQTSLVQSILNLQDEAKLNAIRSVIENSATKAAQQGFLYSADPRNESDDWKRQRHELDREATQAVQALLTESERSLFDRRFLGALIMDLTPGQWDPSFEFIDPILRGSAQEDFERAVLERSPATGALVPVAPPP